MCSDINSLQLSPELRLGTTVAYAAPAFALAVVGIPVYIYIPKFYTDVVGVNMSILGGLLLGVRIFDAVTDPAIGFVSDRTRTSYGRRRPYIAGGAIALAISIYFLFNPPLTSPDVDTVWFGFWIFALFLFWTVVTIPYESMGPEITFDYDRRTTLFAMRDGALIFGTLVAAVSPATISWVLSISPAAEGERSKFFWTSVFYAPLVVIFCWWCVLSVKERTQHRERGSSVWRGLKDVIRNRPFVILVTSNTVSSLGNNLPAVLILYYVEYVLRSRHADFFLILYFITGIAFLPSWIMVSKRAGKKRTWLASMAVNTGAFFATFFLGPGDEMIYGILVFLSGIGFGATVVIPSAMQADVIDYDELLSGERREGQYIGIWAITRKLAAALGVGIAFAILGTSGYVPNIEQSTEVLLTLRILYTLVPCSCNTLAFVILLAYPISRGLHQEILRAISERRAGVTVADPLRSGHMLDSV